MTFTPKPVFAAIAVVLSLASPAAAGLMKTVRLPISKENMRPRSGFGGRWPIRA